VRLTPEGHELHTIAEEILQAHRDGLARFEAFVAQGREKLVIAALPSLAASYLPRIVSEYRKRYRDVTVRIHDGARDWVEQAVLSGSADLGLTGCAEETSELMTTEEISRDAFHAVLRPDDELCAKKVITWKELASRPFVSLSVNSSIRPLTDAAFRAANASVNHAFETSQVVSAAGLVAAGLGVSALPALTLPLVRFAEVAVRPLVSPTVSRQIFLLSRRAATSGPAQRFRNVMLLERARRAKPDY
jgi:DNA-binding transcriptional LysR family regulator